MAFDPGPVGDLALNAHASAIMMGLLYARGWRRAQPEVHIGNAADWPDRWWRDTLGPGAFVVETALSPDARCEVDDLAIIMSLTAVPVGPRHRMPPHDHNLDKATGPRDQRTITAGTAVRWDIDNFTASSRRGVSSKAECGCVRSILIERVESGAAWA